MSEPLAFFTPNLIRWQARHGRHDLPWQNTVEAYRVWLSEIMLQQTQVATVIPYYLRFLERYPTLDALGAARLEDVLELWAGLGYYARARNLHRLAQILVARKGRNKQAEFPQNAEELLALPGIGRSTAAAICVFAFGQQEAILDGNVKRVFTRCFGIEGDPASSLVEKELWALAIRLLPRENIRGGIQSYTQGLMDLGATVCLRSKPTCEVCPMQPICVAFKSGRQAELPFRKPKKSLPERETSCLLLTDGAMVLLERRPPMGIWGGLLALPELAENQAERFAKRQGCSLLACEELPSLKHTFSHFHLHIRVFRCEVERQSSGVGESGWEWTAVKDLENAALPAPMKRIFASLSDAPVAI